MGYDSTASGLKSCNSRSADFIVPIPPIWHFLPSYWLLSGLTVLLARHISLHSRLSGYLLSLGDHGFDGPHANLSDFT